MAEGILEKRKSRSKVPMRVFIESYWNPKRSERIGDHRGEREIAQRKRQKTAAAAVRSFVAGGCVSCVHVTTGVGPLQKPNG